MLYIVALWMCVLGATDRRGRRCNPRGFSVRSVVSYVTVWGFLLLARLVIMVITVMSGVIINTAVGTDISIQLHYQQWTDM